MLVILLFCLFARWSEAALHHLFVGTVSGGSLYLLEMDDLARTLTVLQNSTAAGASPSIALDQSKLYLFGSRPSDGTISRYSVATDYSLKLEGTMDIPQSCNSTAFASVKLVSSAQRPYSIFGSASTGTCSALFSISPSGFQSLRSDAVAGDIRSFAWSPNNHHLYALDSKSNSLLNFNISDDPSLHELISTDAIANTTTARQVITHPTGHRVYIVTHDTNELIEIPLLTNDRIDASRPVNHSAILPKGTANDQYVTTSLAISYSNNTLWTLTHTKSADQRTFIITAWSLDASTGAVQGRVARASFTNNLGDGTKATSVLVPVPSQGDMVAITTYPGAMVAVVGLVGTSIASYGRALLGQDEGCCGEGVWID